MDNKINKERLDVLLTEVNTLNELIATEKDVGVKEELKQERLELVALINNLLGTDHIAKGSVITTINNE